MTHAGILVIAALGTRAMPYDAARLLEAPKHGKSQIVVGIGIQFSVARPLARAPLRR
jgi:hypothetical protein